MTWSANQFSGALPANLNRLTALRTLDLSHNLLLVVIPFRLADLGQLTYLDLSHNSLTGNLPFGDDTSTALQYLDLSHNHLESGMPWVLNDVRALTHLDLSHNALDWDISAEYGSLTALTYLDLHANRLTGVIQPTLGDLHALTYLDLSANHLTYNIPPSWAASAARSPRRRPSPSISPVIICWMVSRRHWAGSQDCAAWICPAISSVGSCQQPSPNTHSSRSTSTTIAWNRPIPAGATLRRWRPRPCAALRTGRQCD